MVVGLVAALLAAVLFGVIAVVQAVIIRRHGLFSWPMVGVLAAYLLGWLLHLVAIAELPLYLAQVGIAGSLVVTALIASSVIGEPLTAVHWLAVAGLATGLALLAAAAGAVGDSAFTARTTLLLYLVLLLNAGLGWAAARWSSPHSGSVLGALAGLAYAGSPVATRSLVEPGLDLQVLAPALTIGLYGALGFVLYSTAMKRTSVTAATAPLVLLQTVLPAVIGLVAFDDGVRTGWWPIAVVAFAISVAGAVVLAGAEARLEQIDPDAALLLLPAHQERGEVEDHEPDPEEESERRG